MQILLANILRSGAWKFDMEKNIVEPYDSNNKAKGIIYKWKNHEDYPDVAIDYIILDSKVNGKKHDLPLIQDVETINFNVVYM